MRRKEGDTPDSTLSPGEQWRQIHQRLRNQGLPSDMPPVNPPQPPPAPPSQPATVEQIITDVDELTRQARRQRERENRPRGYPQTVAEVIDDNLKYRKGTIAAMRKYKRSKPWRGTLEERYAKADSLLTALSNIYSDRLARQMRRAHINMLRPIKPPAQATSGMETALTSTTTTAKPQGIGAKPLLILRNIDGTSSGPSQYIPALHAIVITGHLSIITLLHEFAHAMRYDEYMAVKWSLNLYKRTFPILFSRMTTEGHMVLATDITGHMRTPPAATGTPTPPSTSTTGPTPPTAPPTSPPSPPPTGGKKKTVNVKRHRRVYIDQLEPNPDTRRRRHPIKIYAVIDGVKVKK